MPHRVLRRCLVMWAVVASVPAIVGTPRAQELAEVQRIEILGAEVIDAGELRSLMRTRAPSFWRPFRSTPYRRDILSRDIERIERTYHDRGYLDASAEVTSVITDEGGGVEITITIDEGDPTIVEEVELEGYETLRRQLALDVIQTAPGNRYSPSQVAIDRQRLLELYADRGRPYTTVSDTVFIDEQRARVTFLIDEAPVTRIDDVRIDGTRATKNYVVRRELTFGRGDLLERSELIASRGRLLSTGFFRDVRFEALPTDSLASPRIVDLRLTVAERKMGWVESGVGYNSSNQLRLSGEVGHRNVLGNAHRLIGRARVGLDLDALVTGDRSGLEESRLELSFREPWVFSRRNVGTLSIFSELNRSPDITSPGGVREEDFRGIAVAVDRGLNTPIRLRGAFETRWTTQDVIAADVTDPDSLVIVEERFVTRSLSVFAQRDYRGNPLDPVQGSLQNVLAQYTGGSSNFTKLSLSASWYRALPGQMVAAARIRTGWIHPFNEVSAGERELDLVPRSERFKAGGATTVRGYPEDALGPQTVEEGQRRPATDRGLFTIVTNLELRVPLLWRLGGAVFLDGGQVWERIQDFNISRLWPGSEPTLEDYRYSVGGGIRFASPVGPLRIDYGYALVRGEPERTIDTIRNGEWHFSLGQAF